MFLFIILKIEEKINNNNPNATNNSPSLNPKIVMPKNDLVKINVKINVKKIMLDNNF